MTNNGCPCLYTTPCHKQCTCVNGMYSYGCERCARYGSIEQKTIQAIHLAGLSDENVLLKAALEGQVSVLIEASTENLQRAIKAETNLEEFLLEVKSFLTQLQGEKVKTDEHLMKMYLGNVIDFISKHEHHTKSDIEGGS